MYFSYEKNYVTIANYNTQKTYYKTKLKIDKSDNENTFDKLRNWLNDFINNTTNEELDELESFKIEKRKNVNVKLNEGDFFVFKIDRREYGYGRIILDIRKLRRKADFKLRKNYGLKLMGQPIAVKIYNIRTSNKNIPLKEVKGFDSFPTEYMMDNVLFYGEYEIIGDLPIDDSEIDFPI